MPEVTKNQPGTFCWAELAARKPAEAKKFYKEIFAWSFDEQQMPGDGVYIMCKVRDQQVCGLCDQQKHEIERGVPPHWSLYISVTSADATVSRVAELGGKVHGTPFDVLDVGRMAVIEDPAGGIVALWQPKKHRGAGLMHEPQTIEWNELTSTDPAAALPFYTGLFGWTARTSSDLGVEYTEFHLGAEPVAGMLESRMPGAPSAWTPYFSVTDCDRTAKAAVALGGQTLLEPHDVPTVGRIAVIQDPEGAVFGLVRMENK